MPDTSAPDAPTDLRGDFRLVNYKIDQLDKKFDELKANFATKAEVADVKDDVASIKSGIWWVVKLVLGAVIIAVIGLVMAKGGVPHP